MVGVSKLLLSAATREMVGGQEEGKYEGVVGQEWVGELVGLFVERVGGMKGEKEEKAEKEEKEEKEKEGLFESCREMYELAWNSLDLQEEQQQEHNQGDKSDPPQQPQDLFSPTFDLPQSFSLIYQLFVVFHQNCDFLQGEEGKEFKKQVGEVGAGMGRLVEIKGWGKGGKGGKGGKFNLRFKKRVSVFRKHHQQPSPTSNITPRKVGKKGKKGKGGESGGDPEDDLSSSSATSISQCSSQTPPLLSATAPTPPPLDPSSSLSPSSLSSSGGRWEPTPSSLSEQISSLPPLLCLRGGEEGWEEGKETVGGLLEEGVLGLVVELAGKVFFSFLFFFLRKKRETEKKREIIFLFWILIPPPLYLFP